MDIKVVVGAGPYNNNPGWVHTQEEELHLLNKCMWEKKFAPESISAILAEHVWEHLTFAEGVAAANICYTFLKPLGYIRCAVPDGFFPDPTYQNTIQVGGPGPIDHPAASHKIVHTYHTLTNMFARAGFDVKCLEYCNEQGKFHYSEWDGQDGVIYWSKKYDRRNQGDTPVFPSLIVDAIKRG